MEPLRGSREDFEVRGLAARRRYRLARRGRLHRRLSVRLDAVDAASYALGAFGDVNRRAAAEVDLLSTKLRKLQAAIEVPRYLLGVDPAKGPEWTSLQRVDADGRVEELERRPAELREREAVRGIVAGPSRIPLYRVYETHLDERIEPPAMSPEARRHLDETLAKCRENMEREAFGLLNSPRRCIE